MNRQEIQIYSPTIIYQQGLSGIIKKMIINIFKNRDLIWQLFLRDFKARYKQSLLGWAWIFLMPIVTMGTFLLLNISGIIKIGAIPVPYPIFGLLGFSLWQVLANGWLVLTNSISSSGSLITQINFPKETLVFASMGQIIVDFFIRIVLVLIVYFLYGLKPSLFLLILPLYLLPLILLTLGLGFITAMLNVIIRDTKNFIDVGLGFFLFLMPIMYSIPEKGLLAKINLYNPVYYLVDVPRSLFILGEIKNPLPFILSSLLAIMIFFLGWFVFFLSQSKLSERV